MEIRWAHNWARSRVQNDARVASTPGASATGSSLAKDRTIARERAASRPIIEPLFERAWIDVSRKDATSRSDFGRERQRQVSATRADIRNRHACLEIQHLPKSLHFRASSAEAADGLVEFVDNPRHRRSKLVRLTRKGAARYREMSARFLAMASTLGGELNETRIRKTTAVVRQLSADVTAGLSSDRV